MALVEVAPQNVETACAEIVRIARTALQTAGSVQTTAEMANAGWAKPVGIVRTTAGPALPSRVVKKMMSPAVEAVNARSVCVAKTPSVAMPNGTPFALCNAKMTAEDAESKRSAEMESAVTENPALPAPRTAVSVRTPAEMACARQAKPAKPVKTIVEPAQSPREMAAWVPMSLAVAVAPVKPACAKQTSFAVSQGGMKSVRNFVETAEPIAALKMCVVTGDVPETKTAKTARLIAATAPVRSAVMRPVIPMKPAPRAHLIVGSAPQGAETGTALWMNRARHVRTIAGSAPLSVETETVSLTKTVLPAHPIVAVAMMGVSLRKTQDATDAVAKTVSA